MQLVDSHCHLDFDDLRMQLPAVLARAAEHSVAYMLCVAVNLENYPRLKKLTAAYANLFLSTGVHPNETEGREPTADELTDLANDPAVVAVGETGLDYFRQQARQQNSGAKLDWQRARFENHIQAAIAVGKPLIIHTRAAAADTMAMLKNLGADRCGGVMHCFAEDWGVAKRALDLGFYISFSGIVTFKNAAAIKEVARKVPLENILIETDAPYLAPTPLRGKTNEPSFIVHTAQCIADLRGTSLAEIAAATYANFFKLFAAARPIPASSRAQNAA